MPEAVYVVGIDLGTTNSVVAYTEINVNDGEFHDIRILKIPQLVGEGSLGEREILPSFIYLPGPYDIPDGSLALPWDEKATIAIGEFARNRGSEIPHRLISSAKSWLCHTGIDRNKPVLPWQAPEDLAKKSPVEASAAILSHIRNAWNDVMSHGDSRLALENQDLFLTVPASFDAVARDLTVKAALIAGLSNAVLLEEPQAAMYAWIDKSREEWRDKVKINDSILVVDVGGGTTDFSLIKVKDEGGNLVLERIAVGDHVLVGGDNMDLALAYTIASRLASSGKRLDSSQMRGLTHSCRYGKEALLNNPDMEHYPVTILGKGSSLIGGSIKASLTRSDVDQILMEGFMPHCDITSRPVEQKKSGIREMGLSYSCDPAITHHLAHFLNRQQPSDGHDSNVFPTAVIFNGGVMKSVIFRRRIMDILASWEPSGRTSIREINGADYDLAVARGAAYYGLSRKGKGIRIRGGLARSYYMGIEAAFPAVPGMPAVTKALCLAPFGTEEGSEIPLPAEEFGLVVGEPVQFNFMGSVVRKYDVPGGIVEDWSGEIDKIAVLETILVGKEGLDGEEGTVIPVTLHVRVTEMGVLEIWCISCEDGKRFKLEFSVREKENLSGSG